MRHQLPNILLTVLTTMCAPLAFAQTQEHEAESAHEATHDFHRNFVSGFVGITDEGSESGPTLGIAYERLLNESFAVGLIAEHTFDELDFWLYAASFAYRTGQWKWYIAPGVADGEHNTESLLRLGVEYAFEIGAVEIAPHLAMDFVDGEEAIVLGVVIGKAF